MCVEENTQEPTGELPGPCGLGKISRDMTKPIFVGYIVMRFKYNKFWAPQRCLSDPPWDSYRAKVGGCQVTQHSLQKLLGLHYPA